MSDPSGPVNSGPFTPLAVLIGHAAGTAARLADEWPEITGS